MAAAKKGRKLPPSPSVPDSAIKGLARSQSSTERPRAGTDAPHSVGSRTGETRGRRCGSLP